MSTPNQERSEFESETWEIYKQFESLMFEASEFATSREKQAADKIKDHMLDLVHMIVSTNESEKIA